jgi:hypothetical protein
LWLTRLTARSMAITAGISVKYSATTSAASFSFVSVVVNYEDEEAGRTVGFKQQPGVAGSK